MKIFSFLKQEILSLDTKINQSLSEKEIEHLVIKNIDLCNKGGLSTIDDKGQFKRCRDLYGFGIQYTFFEDIEEERTGFRPNDVYLSIMFFVKDNKVKIEQMIGGGLEVEDYEFPDIEYIHSDHQDYSHLFNFDKIFILLLKAIQEFVASRK